MSDAISVAHKKLSWFDGFAFSLGNPIGIFVTMNYAIGTLGSLSVAVLFFIVSLVAYAQNKLYTEMAFMFPGRSGGIATFANEAWGKYCSPIGAIAALGYWLAWTAAVSVFALTFGQLIQAQFYPEIQWTISLGVADIGLSHVLGAVALAFISLVNCISTKYAANLNKVIGAVALALIAAITIVPFVTGSYDFTLATNKINFGDSVWGGMRLSLAMMFVFAWSAYGTEICATFANEYKSPFRDTVKALRASGLFMLVAVIVMPIGLGASVGDTVIAANPTGVFAIALQKLIGPAAAVVAVILAASMLILMNSCMADSGQALYGLAKERLTIKQFDHLNKFGLPARCIMAGLVINMIVLFFVGNILGIIFASNISYILTVTLVLFGFVLLRKDRPNWPRPFKLGSHWIFIAVVLGVFNLTLLVVGGLSPEIAGYGGTKEQVVALCVLGAVLLSYFYRRIIQDGNFKWREAAQVIGS
ncbi:hypothetical protein AEQ67_19080 [Pseudomonas sp. RIT-PI-q]|uniref:APC family permease n=1 Tax=Pseudomonas sp. RIT-PI-q TaxID=1690247 RepID=UPI0006CC25B9|nr:APC family permease [Pseudomonas sp. RIT-PI-q]KPG96027.1 hypothetical protein AEQ67_19080 [Pseudomonas sp. RIT-PI-q]